MVDAVSAFHRDTQRDLKRQAILSTASFLFNTKGMRGTTLADIAKKLHITKTGLYYYFKNKEDLAYHCFLASFDRRLETLNKASALDAPGLQKILSVIYDRFDSWKNALLGVWPNLVVPNEIHALKPDQREDIMSRNADSVSRLTKLIQAGADDGSVRDCDPKTTAVAIFGTLDWAPLWLPRLPIDQFDDVADATASILAEGLYTGKSDYDFPILEFASSQTPLSTGFNRQQQNQLKREAFCKIGTSFFNRKGFNGTSLDEIAKKLGVTKGAFYYHIRDKDDLLFKCFDRTLNLTEYWQNRAAEEGATGLDKLDRAARYLFNIQFSDEGPLIRFNSLISLQGARRKKVLVRTAACDKQLGEFIREGIDDGTIRAVDSVVAEHIVSGAIHASAAYEDFDFEPAARDVIGILINGLAPRKKARATRSR